MVYWHLSLPGGLMVNMDDAAVGSSGQVGGGGIF